MMHGKQVSRYIVALLFTIALTTRVFAQSSSGAELSDARDNGTLEAKATGLIELEMLRRAGQRVEALRARLLEIQLKEVELQGRIDELDYQLTPERIDRALAFVGSVRPMDELRNELRRKLENQKARVSQQLELLASNRERVEAAISAVEMEVERLRQRLGSP